MFTATVVLPPTMLVFLLLLEGSVCLFCETVVILQSFWCFFSEKRGIENTFNESSDPEYILEKSFFAKVFRTCVVKVQFTTHSTPHWYVIISTPRAL